jgi:hypothetical protein
VKTNARCWIKQGLARRTLYWEYSVPVKDDVSQLFWQVAARCPTAIKED